VIARDGESQGGPQTSCSPQECLAVLHWAERVVLQPFSRGSGSSVATRPQCEFANETDPALLRVLLKGTPGLGGGYWWVECGSCACGWQVPHYAESVG
jgi:hypothetical protein